MAEDVFLGIDFTLPAQGKLNAAREIGRRCGTAWYAHDPEALLPGFPDSISAWSERCRSAWREGHPEPLPVRNPPLGILSPQVGLDDLGTAAG